jgi:hypothetical protein
MGTDLRLSPCCLLLPRCRPCSRAGASDRVDNGSNWTKSSSAIRLEGEFTRHRMLSMPDDGKALIM